MVSNDLNLEIFSGFDSTGASFCDGLCGWRVVWLTGVAHSLKHTIAFCDTCSRYEFSQSLYGIFLAATLAIRLLSVLRSINPPPFSFGDLDNRDAEVSSPMGRLRPWLLRYIGFRA
jgi:hypothetical protein